MLLTHSAHSRRPLRPVALGAATALALSLSLGGCSGDDSSKADDPPASASTDEAATKASDALIQSGLDQLEAGDATTARTTFENVLTIEPGNVFALYNLGVISQTAGDTDQAIDFYDRALITEDDYAPALFNKAIMLESGDLDQSIQLYRRAVASDDEMAAAYMRLGFALVHQGKDEEGADALERGITLDPSMTNVEAPNYG